MEEWRRPNNHVNVRPKLCVCSRQWFVSTVPAHLFPATRQLQERIASLLSAFCLREFPLLTTHSHLVLNTTHSHLVLNTTTTTTAPCLSSRETFVALLSQVLFSPSASTRLRIELKARATARSINPITLTIDIQPSHRPSRILLRCLQQSKIARRRRRRRVKRLLVGGITWLSSAPDLAADH
jgi:hypothetical protein